MELNIQTAASLLTAGGIIVAALFKLVDFLRKPSQQDKAIQELHDKHVADMEALREELQVLCYGLRGALQGLVEAGYNGPCKDALKALDKHLNKSAHEP